MLELRIKLCRFKQSYQPDVSKSNLFSLFQAQFGLNVLVPIGLTNYSFPPPKYPPPPKKNSCNLFISSRMQVGWKVVKLRMHFADSF